MQTEQTRSDLLAVVVWRAVVERGARFVSDLTIFFVFPRPSTNARKRKSRRNSHGALYYIHPIDDVIVQTTGASLRRWCPPSVRQLCLLNYDEKKKIAFASRQNGIDLVYNTINDARTPMRAYIIVIPLLRFYCNNFFATIPRSRL